MRILERKGLEFDLPLYALKRGDGIPKRPHCAMKVVTLVTQCSIRGKLKQNSFVSSPHMFILFLAIIIINATFILLIHGVVFSTSKKYDYPPLLSNVGWLGLLSVVHPGGQCSLGCRGAIIAQLPNIIRHPVQTARSRSMGGRTKTPGSGMHMSPNAMLNVRPTLYYVGTYAGKGSVGPRNGSSGARSERPDVLQPRDHRAALLLYSDREGIAQFFLEKGWFAQVTDPSIMYSYL
ncbi:hypothetical protein V2J09_018013 [Rumex salicifolius]